LLNNTKASTQLLDVNDLCLLRCAGAEPLSCGEGPHALINPPIKVAIKEGIIVSIETTEKISVDITNNRKGSGWKYWTAGAAQGFRLPCSWPRTPFQPGLGPPVPAPAMSQDASLQLHPSRCRGDMNLCARAKHTPSPAVLLRKIEISQMSSIRAGKTEPWTRSQVLKLTLGFEEAGGEEAQRSSGQRRQRWPGLLFCLFHLERKKQPHGWKTRGPLWALVWPGERAQGKEGMIALCSSRRGITSGPTQKGIWIWPRSKDKRDDR